MAQSQSEVNSSQSKRGSGYPKIGPLYLKMTDNRVDNSSDNSLSLAGARDIFGALSLSTQFKASLHLVKQNGSEDILSTYLTRLGLTSSAEQNEYYNFYCSETNLPGSSFETFSEIGSRQGIVETFPTKRSYPDVSMTFYVDNDYRLITLFEEWMNYINPIYSSGGLFPGDPMGQGNMKQRENFFRMRYPDSYKRIISITKFERNFIRYDLNNPKNAGKLGNVPTLTYRLIDAYPTNIAGYQLSYEGSTILKTIVNFSYSRYVIEKNPGDGKDDFKRSSSPVQS